MKKIILMTLVGLIISLPASSKEITVDLSPVIEATTRVGDLAWRTVKYPFALTVLIARDVVNGEPIRTLRQAWVITEK